MYVISTPTGRHGAGLLLVVLLYVFGPKPVDASEIENWLTESCPACAAAAYDKSGVYILEKGEESLIGRAWLTQHATRSIDVQYFIWSTDNIGTLAAEQLLTAAERGVNVRVIVDDFLIDADEVTLAALAANENVDIRIYNPNISLGQSIFSRLVNALTRFRDVNQRMHDKTAIFDGIAGITGGRNMADEYFDHDPDYNFRDRDVLVVGAAVRDMQENFNEFWDSEFAVPVEDVLDGRIGELTAAAVQRYTQELHAYAADPENFEPQIRAAIAEMPVHFPRLLDEIRWGDAVFVNDVPGKNDGSAGLAGGGESTAILVDQVRNARSSVLIQSPYLVMPKGGIELFAALVKAGVRIRISTNSLASTDNIPAFSGYHRQRRRLLLAGVELYEYRPHPAIQAELVDRYPALAARNPQFALHAKSMVIDDELVYIGTFNLDPRSANLNTEVGILIRDAVLAERLTGSIEKDIHEENSWRTTMDFVPDYEVGRGKRVQLGLLNLLPIEPLL